MEDPKKYDDISDWAKTLTKEDAEKIYYELNAGFNTAAAKKRAEEIRAKVKADVEAEMQEKGKGEPQTADQPGADNIHGNLDVKCPKCGSSNVARILYGMPAFSKELQADMDSGKIVLGGCLVDDNIPDFHCNKCGEEF